MATRNVVWILFLIVVLVVCGAFQRSHSEPEQENFHCDKNGIWPQIHEELMKGIQLMQQGDFLNSKMTLTNAAVVATADLKAAMKCAIGISSLYRAMTFTYCANPSLEGPALLRANQLCLRLYHLAMNFLTEAFVKGGNTNVWIDNSVWPLSIQEIVDNGNAINGVVARLTEGKTGHYPSSPDVPTSYRDRGVKIGIVSLCAYPKGHLLPIYSISNKEIYAQLHGYDLMVETERLDTTRPHAWGKILMMKKHLAAKTHDWLMWMDCDSYFMNVNVTLEYLLIKYGGYPTKNGRYEMDPEVEQLVSEDASMLNTGIFFFKSSDANVHYMERIYGKDDSPWITHPWWENAAMAWEYLHGFPEQTWNEDHQQFMEKNDYDSLRGIYPPYVRLVPQWELNSYHPITSRFQHDTWEGGKFILSFSGAPSGSSKSVMDHLYGNYYREFCDMHKGLVGVADKCIKVDDILPWNTKSYGL